MENENCQCQYYNAMRNISETLRLLGEAKAFADSFGVERLDYLTGFASIVQSKAYPQPTFTTTDILSEVEAIGLILNATLVTLIKECSVEDVRYAIDVVKEIYKRETVKNPEGLFYRVLDNKRKSKAFDFDY